MNMRRIFLSLFMAVSLLAAAMTDDQVIAYIKSAAAAGKSDKQIGEELMAKGGFYAKLYQSQFQGEDAAS